ncbi:cytochrome ubiquinol oxidase subunit I [Thermodesulfobacteriota bacterium]
MTGLEFPVLGAKWAIGVVALFHTSVASMGIGFAFFVSVSQIRGFINKDRSYDILAKRIQLIHVCIYNIGTITAIGLIFLLSGLFPQFWSQIFVQFYWAIIVEEFLFFLLATTLTFHYFFWDRMWGHKKLHIFLGTLLTPLFFLQFYIINGLGSFMLTPGFGEAEHSLLTGVLGWDRMGFYNPSFLMLTVHRTLANVAYGSFSVAGLCGILLYFTKKENFKGLYENGGRLAFQVAFMAFLSLPIAGYFYAHVLKAHANEAYINLMWGRGDVAAGGVDWWWLKHILVATMMGICLSYFHRRSKEQSNVTVPSIMVYSVAVLYLMFYIAMGMVMTWAFFWFMLVFASGGAILALHLLKFHQGSGKGVFLLVGILSFFTVLFGGYSREASRPRFVDRISHYDKIFIPEQRQPYLMTDIEPEEIPKVTPRILSTGPASLIRERCSGCHTLTRVKNYSLENWDVIVRQMGAYGLKLSNEEREQITAHLENKEPY